MRIPIGILVFAWAITGIAAEPSDSSFAGLKRSNTSLSSFFSSIQPSFRSLKRSSTSSSSFAPVSPNSCQTFPSKIEMIDPKIRDLYEVNLKKAENISTQRELFTLISRLLEEGVTTEAATSWELGLSALIGYFENDLRFLRVLPDTDDLYDGKKTISLLQSEFNRLREGRKFGKVLHPTYPKLEDILDVSFQALASIELAPEIIKVFQDFIVDLHDEFTAEMWRCDEAVLTAKIEDVWSASSEARLSHQCTSPLERKFILASKNVTHIPQTEEKEFTGSANIQLRDSYIENCGLKEFLAIKNRTHELRMIVPKTPYTTKGPTSLNFSDFIMTDLAPYKQTRLVLVETYRKMLSRLVN